jgi:hypothetical protein
MHPDKPNPPTLSLSLSSWLLARIIPLLSLLLSYFLVVSLDFFFSFHLFSLVHLFLSQMSSSTDDFSSEYGSKVTGACVACKRAHHACDQERPQCARCVRLGCSCEYVLHRKPGRKRLQAIPPPESDDTSAKKRRLLSDVSRDVPSSLSSVSSSMSPSPTPTSAHLPPRPPSSVPRPPQEQRHIPSILPFSKKISSTSSHATFGSFPQSDGGGERAPYESAKVPPQFSSEKSSSSTSGFLENPQSIRRPSQKAIDHGNYRGSGDPNDMRRLPPHPHFSSPHHSGISKNISEFHNLVLEGERELMNFNRSQKDEGKSFISPINLK